MKNYMKVSLEENAPRVELHDKLGLTGAEISIICFFLFSFFNPLLKIIFIIISLFLFFSIVLEKKKKC